jgi:excisionase family DNA binding protein
MLSEQAVNQIAQAVAARLLPHLKNSNGSTATLSKKLLTIKEAAVYLGRSETAIYRLVAKRDIPVVRHGRNLRFELRSLDAWVEGDQS